VGNTFSNLGRQLLDGHWVLSFIDADRCAAARDLVDGGQVRSVPVPYPMLPALGTLRGNLLSGRSSLH